MVRLEPDLRALKALIGKLETQIENYVIPVSKNTRRMLNQTYRKKMKLQKLKKLKRALVSKQENFDIRQQVRALKAAKRRPAPRSRSREFGGYRKMPPIFYSNNGIVFAPANNYGFIGGFGIMQDVHPILKLSPPISPMSAQRYLAGSLSNSFSCRGGRVIVEAPKAQWAAMAAQSYTIANTTGTVINFELGKANAVLQKAYAKVYSADIQMNEYVFEAKQVLQLLRDPIRTVIKSHKLLKKWVASDQWMFLPSHVARKCGDGVLVSTRPTGAVLMSMRTRKTISPESVPVNVLNEAANRWLQYRYGIVPLVSDVTKVYETWLDEPIKLPLKTESAKIWVTKTRDEFEYPYYLGQLYLTTKIVRTTGHFYSAKVWYQLNGSVPSSYKMGMHPTQFLNALYNAVPFSFVADWVVNLDQWMVASMNVDWIQPVTNVVTVKDFNKIHVTLKSAKFFSSPYYPATCKGSFMATKTMERVKRMVNLPRPTEPVVSSAWSSLKNFSTGLALYYQSLFRSVKYAN